MTSGPMSEAFIQSIYDLAREEHPPQGKATQWAKARKIVTLRSGLLELIEQAKRKPNSRRLGILIVGRGQRLETALQNYHVTYGDGGTTA